MPLTFTGRAAEVMRLATAEARRLRHEYLGTEHLLLGLLREGRGIGCGVLRALGVDLARAEAEVRRIVQAGPDLAPPAALSTTPRAAAALAFAAEEAGLSNAADTGHLLVGLLREEEAVAAQVLMNQGALRDHPLAALRNRVLSERMRLPDDAEPDALRKPDGVCDRAASVRRAGWAAASHSALLSVPISLAVAAAFWLSGLPRDVRVVCCVHVLLWTNVCWISIAASVHRLKAREATMTPEGLRLLRRHVFWAAVQATGFASLVVVPVLVTWPYGAGEGIMVALIILGIWVGSAAAVGHARGMAAARALEEGERLSAGRVEGRPPAALDDARRGLIQSRDGVREGPGG